MYLKFNPERAANVCEHFFLVCLRLNWVAPANDYNKLIFNVSVYSSGVSVFFSFKNGLKPKINSLLFESIEFWLPKLMS